MQFKTLYTIRAFFIVLGCMVHFMSMAQIQVSGVVVDDKGAPVIGANVFIRGSYDGASTDVEGKFTFTTAAKDTATLKVESLGFEPTETPVQLNRDIKDLRIQIKEKFNQLNAVTITAGAFEASDSKKAVALRPLDIVTTAGASGDIAGALRTLPGTTNVGESGRLFVRGGSAEETQTYVDGLLVHEPYSHTAPNTAVRGRFNPFIFSGTVFTTGGYSAEYGQALSSVLLLNTKDIELQDEWNLSFMTLGVDAAGTKVWDRASVTANISYIDLTPYNNLVPQNQDFSRMPTVLNASLSARQKTGKSGMLKFYGTQANTDYGIYSAVPGENRKENINGGDDNSYLNASWKGLLGEKWSLRTGMAYSRNKDNTSIDDFDITRSLEAQHLKAVLGHSPSDKVNLKMGLDLMRKDLSESYNVDSIPAVAFEELRAGLFTEADIFLSSDLALRAGIRAEHGAGADQLKRNTTVAPRLMAAYRLGDASQISLAYGLFYQDSDERILLYSQGVDQERADHYILNYQYLNQQRTFRVEVYQKNYKDLVKTAQDDFGEYSYFNSGKGYARGLDIWWRDKKTVKNGDYWISYSYLDTERDYRDYPHAAIPSFAAKHNFSLVYKHWIQDWRSQVGGTFSYTSPRSYNDPNSLEFQSAKMEAVQQVNLNWAYLYRENVIFYTSVSNVLGQEQQYGYRFAEQPGADGVYAREAILPTARRFFFLGCFITLSHKATNQLDKIE